MFDNLMEKRVLASNVFAFFMVYDQEENATGLKPSLTLGYYDLALTKGPMDWHMIKTKFMFGIKLDDIKVNGKALNVCERLRNPEKCMITIDSGSTTGMVPIDSIPAFTSNQIPIANHMAECDSAEDIGSITWVINGKEYTLNADEWIIESDISLTQT